MAVDPPRDPRLPPAPGGGGGPPWWRTQGTTVGGGREGGGVARMEGIFFPEDVSLGGEEGSDGSMNPDDGFQ